MIPDNYVARAINAGIRAKRREPFKAPANARLKKAIRSLYKKTPGATVGEAGRGGRNALFGIRFLLANGETKGEFFEASKALQAGERVMVQLWECTKEPTPFPSCLFDADAHDGEFVMRAEKPVAMTPGEFARHAR